MPTRRVVVLSYFGVDEGDRLVQALERGLLQRDVPVCIGSYGIAPRVAARVAELPDTRYAPIFTLKRSALWERRSLDPAREQSRSAHRSVPKSGGGERSHGSGRQSDPTLPAGPFIGRAVAGRTAVGLRARPAEGDRAGERANEEASRQ